MYSNKKTEYYLLIRDRVNLVIKEYVNVVLLNQSNIFIHYRYFILHYKILIPSVSYK